jgi:hypothetical protein
MEIKKSFLYFLSLLLFENRSRLLNILIPSSIVLFFLFSSIFILNSIENYYLALKQNLNKTSCNYQRYFITPRGDSFLLTTNKDLNNKEMIIGDGVAKWLKNHYYDKSYNFISQTNGDLIKLNAKKILDSSFSFSDVVIISPYSFERIFGNLKPKIVQEKSLLFNYKAGLFKVLFLVFFIAFLMIFYLRFILSKSISKENKILLALGWDRKFLIFFRSLESLIISFLSSSFAFVFAYLFVFKFNAPLLRSIFFGVSNISNSFLFIPTFNFLIIFFIFIFYLILALFIDLKAQETKRPLVK